MVEQKNEKLMTVEDMEILLKSYKNMIEMNSLIVQKIEQLIEMQKDLLNKVGGQDLKLRSLCDAINNTVSKTNELVSIFKEMEPNLEQGHEDITKKIEEIKSKMNTQELENVKDSSKISMKIYVAWGMSATIILSLISLVWSMVAKYEKIDAMFNVIIAIGKKMGVTF